VLAKATVATRVAGGTLAKPQSDQPGRLSQLFTDDSDTPDVFDVQYVVFNIVAMVFVVVAFGRAGLSTGFPAIPEGLLLLTGGPAAVYVSNKFMPGDAPQIFSVSPHTVRVGQSFTVLGQNLRASTPNADTPEVKVAGVPVPDGGTYSSTSLTAVAPDVGADLGRQVDVSVTSSAGVQTVVTDGLTVLGRVPVLDGADRGVAQVGEDVVLRGDWTADEASGITVLVDDDVVGTIVVPPKPAANTLTFAMPVLANLGGSRSVSVAVKLGTELSKSVSVLVSAPPPPQGNGVPEDAQTRSGVRV
jgi:hypothetical protein